MLLSAAEGFLRYQTWFLYYVNQKIFGDDFGQEVTVSLYLWYGSELINEKDSGHLEKDNVDSHGLPKTIIARAGSDII